MSRLLHPRRAASLVTALTLALVGLVAPSASAVLTVLPDQIRYAGASISGAVVPATRVDLEVWSSTPARKIELFLGPTLVASDSTIETAADHWTATGTVDLSGRSGTTKMTMRVTPLTGTSRSVVKTFTVEPLPVVGVTVADQIRFAGASIHRQVLPGAAALPLEVWSATPAATIELLLGTTVIGTDTTVVTGPGYWIGTATVDLTALPAGAAAMTLRITPASGTARTATKAFTVDPVIAPLTPALLAARPGPTSTGVPAGTTLTPSGSIKVTVPGTVVDGLDITGCVTIAANDVTIRRSRIRCSDSPKGRAIVTDVTRTGLLIEDVEVDGRGTTEIGIDVSNVVIRRVDVHHVNDGIRMGSNITVERSWIHDMSRLGELHPDAIQGISAQNIVIRGNHLDPRDPLSGDRGNAAVMLGSETGTMLSRNVLIEGNYMDGGNCPVNISGSINAENITVRTNRFGTASQYSPVLTPRRVPIAADNVMDTWGTAIKVAYTD